MSIWNSAIGAMIGFSLGGPIGALIGGVIGSRFGAKRASTTFSANQQHQAAFFAALFAFLAKLAKADGKVSKEEIEVLTPEQKTAYESDLEKINIEATNKREAEIKKYPFLYAWPELGE